MKARFTGLTGRQVRDAQNALEDNDHAYTMVQSPQEDERDGIEVESTDAARIVLWAMTKDEPVYR